jgi:uncharacterized protein
MTRTYVQPERDSPESEFFWNSAAAGKLVYQLCTDCSTGRHPPQPRCGRCGSRSFAWKESGGRGKIWSFVVVHAPTLPAFQELTPFPVILVELDDAPGVRLLGNLGAAEGAEINTVPAHEYDIGTPVRVSFRDQDGQVVLPCWLIDQ